MSNWLPLVRLEPGAGLWRRDLRHSLAGAATQYRDLRNTERQHLVKTSSWKDIMDHTIVHFELPADQPERAAKFYRELFGWDIKKFEGPAASAMEYWLVRTLPTDDQGQPTRPGVDGGLMRRMFPGQTPVSY